VKIGRSERLEVSAEYQDHITSLFGVNHYGDPIFRIAWGQSETFDYATARGYSQKLVGHNQPCWMVLRWRPPEIYGSPLVYYALNCDKETGLALLGEYPEFGRYEPIMMLMHKSFDVIENKLVVNTLPLDWDLIEKVIPVLEACERMTEVEKAAAIEANEAAENALMVDEIETRMRDSLPTFYGPTSHAARRIKPSLIERKKDQIEREWKKQAAKGPIRPQRGMFQEPA
jgi:hypothetical protein